jgi:hypothetical protein
MRGLAAAALGLVVLGVVVFLLGSRSGADAPFLTGEGNSPTRASIKEVMQSIVDPSADVLWGAVGTVVDNENGIQDLRPKTPEDWLNVRNAAVRILEGGNLLAMPGREVAPAGTKSETPGVELEPAEIAALIGKDRSTFDGFAKQLQALGAEAVRAADAKNSDGLMDIGTRMDNVCESCHEAFWYPYVSGYRSSGRSASP